MRASPATHTSCRITKKPAGIDKSTRRDAKKPSRQLRSIKSHFWYTSPDGVNRLVSSSGVFREPPQKINKYMFDHTKFAHDEYPSTFPPGANWPPEKALDLLRATGPLGDDCVGCTRCDGAMCHDAWCQHTLERWCAETTHWQDHFELRKTEDRGIGVYTKRSFRPNDILGWYAGEIVPDSETQLENDYLMTVPIGIASELDSPCQSDDDSDDSYTEKPFPSPPRSRVTAATKPDSSSQLSVMVDSQRVGNWTRFINHSCESHAHFRMARVGDMRVMVVEAARNIPAGVELTVHYGPGYYGVSSTRICHCGARKCVSKDRERKARRQARRANRMRK